MKIVKRDGKIVNYDSNKIRVAIHKANSKVAPGERISDDEITPIIEYIESLNKKRMLVEDIQDIIEKKLMELNKYELAKEYIVYRYTRALVRKKNTTDESILGLIKKTNTDLMNENSNKDAVIAATQRDLIAGEVSKDLTKRMLLTPKITEALEISEEQLNYVIDSPSGCGLIKCGNRMVPFDNVITKDSEIYRLYNTNIYEKMEEKKSKAKR